MRYYRIVNRFGDVHLAAETSEGELTSLTSLNEEVSDFCDLLKVEYISGLGVDQITRNILSGGRGETLPKDHPAWDLETDYIALGLMNLISILSPERIILGGGGRDRKVHVPPEVLTALGAEVVEDLARPLG